MQFVLQQRVTAKGTNIKTDLGWYVFFCRGSETLGVIFQLNSNLVKVQLDLSRCLKLTLCHNFFKDDIYL